MFGTLHPDEIEDILFSHHIAHLACIDDDRPYVVPIAYVYDGGALYGRTGAGRKVDALRERPAVAVNIEEHSDPRRWRSVIVTGTWEEIRDTGARQDALGLMEAGFPAIGDGEIVFRIAVREKTGRAVTIPG